MTDTLSSSALNVLGDALARAWGTRPKSERQAFELRIGTDYNAGVAEPPDMLLSSGEGGPTDLSPRYSSLNANEEVEQPAEQARRIGDDARINVEICQRANALERIAAVSGSLSPHTLLQADPPPFARIALDRIAAGFDRTLTDHGWSWTLQSDRRTAVLARLPSSQLRSELENARAYPTDDAGYAFRSLLQKGHLAQGDAPPAIRAIAYSWLALIEPLRSEQAQDLRRRTAQSILLKTFDDMLVDGFVGRASDAEKLRQFALSPYTGDKSPVLSLTGIGGIRKVNASRTCAAARVTSSLHKQRRTCRN